MANVFYPAFKEALLNGDIDLPAGDIRAILVDLADYTYASTDEFLDDVAAGARVAVSGAIGSKTIVDGVFDAANVTWSSVTGDVSEAVLLYVHTGTDATSRLIALFDTATGLPATPNGGDISVEWDATGIFAL